MRIKITIDFPKPVGKRDLRKLNKVSELIKFSSATVVIAVIFEGEFTSPADAIGLEDYVTEMLGKVLGRRAKGHYKVDIEEE